MRVPISGCQNKHHDEGQPLYSGMVGREAQCVVINDYGEEAND